MTDPKPISFYQQGYKDGLAGKPVEKPKEESLGAQINYTHGHMIGSRAREALTR